MDAIHYGMDNNNEAEVKAHYRQLKNITSSLVYSTYFNHGAIGHGSHSDVALLARRSFDPVIQSIVEQVDAIELDVDRIISHANRVAFGLPE